MALPKESQPSVIAATLSNLPKEATHVPDPRVEELFISFYTSLLPVAERFRRLGFDPEDIVMRVFLRWVKKPPEFFDHLEKPESYLKYETFHEGLQLANTARRRYNTAPQDSLEWLQDNHISIESSEDDPLDAYLTKERIEEINQMLAGLSKKGQEVLLLRWQGIPHKEIAQLHPNSRVILFRIRQKLKELTSQEQE